MHPTTLRSGTLFLLTLLAASSALPTTESSGLVKSGEGFSDNTVPASPKPATYVQPKDVLEETGSRHVNGSATHSLATGTFDRHQVARAIAILSELDRRFSSTTDTWNVGKRQEAAVAEAAAGAVMQGAEALFNGIRDRVKSDNDAREQFTQQAVDRGRAQWSQFNWVICHTQHQTQFDGTEGTDWGHMHYELDIKVGGTIGYEAYWFRSGTFTLQGDGGFINWAWLGSVKQQSLDGKVITFQAPS